MVSAEKQAEVDPILNEPVDIGLPFKPQIKTVEKQTNRADLEHLARHRKRKIKTNRLIDINDNFLNFLLSNY